MNKKIKTESEIAEIADKLKKEGRVVVTTNGSFDIFHFGHVKLLEKSKLQGDILIVGINSDKSVKEYKSPERPINSEKERAGIIAALETVNYVFIFDDTTPNRWLKTIKPNIHCNSSEYGKNCVEKPTLNEIGAKLCLIGRDLENGNSTTGIIEKILSIYSKK